MCVHKYPNATMILTSESLKSFAFLVGSRRFSEISQGNGCTHFWQTREDQQGAHGATMICKESGKIDSVHIVPTMIWQNLATKGANLESGVASSLDNTVVIVMREKGCVVSSGHGARHRGRHKCIIGGNRKFIDLAEKPGVFALYISTIHFENSGNMSGPWSLKDRTCMTRRYRVMTFGCPSFAKLSVER